MPNIAEDNVTYAYEPDRSLQELIGKSTKLMDIFTKERIANCQKMVDEAKNSFFDTSQSDIRIIEAATVNSLTQENYGAVCQQILIPVLNIHGQARIFSFSLIASICEALIEYCEASDASHNVRKKDIYIVTKLIEALNRAISERILDPSGILERELVSLVKQARG